MIKVKRQFVDGRFGQIHVRVATPDTVKHRPLICLHMSPKSGDTYTRFMEHAANDRIVVAADYPGYGESDPPPAKPHVTIEDYAASMWDVVDALNLETVDLLGHHTGSEVAAEAARQRPEQVSHIVMISAPVFSADEIDKLQLKYEYIPLDEAGTRFKKMWMMILEHRGPGVTLEMSAASFAENLRAGDRYEWGHYAAFEYSRRFPQIVKSLPHRITVINPQDDLVKQTPNIAPYLTNGEVINCPEWRQGFLDTHTDDAVSVIKAALDKCSLELPDT